MSRTSEMEEKVQALLNECIGIICELPVNDAKLVEEATAGKLDAVNPSAGDAEHAKILIPTLKWLLETSQPKATRKRKATAKPAQKPDKGNGDSTSSGSSVTTPRKKKNADKPTTGPDKKTNDDDLPV
jgi:hypothetical protein